MYVYDTRELERQSENVRNASLRHCKIGKVRHKGEIGFNWPAILPPKGKTFFTAPLNGDYLDFRATNLLGTALNA